MAPTSRFRSGKDPAADADHAPGRFDRLQEVGEPEKMQRLERAPFHLQSDEDRLELRRRAQRKAGERTSKRMPSVVAACAAPTCAGSVIGASLPAARDPSASRQGRHDRHDAIEFEGPECAAYMDYPWLIADATQAAPKPLSMFTTATPLAQLFSMPSSAARPPKLAP